MTNRLYTVAVYEAEPDEGGYWCEVLELPGCVAQGETLDELRSNVAVAIEVWEETWREMGDPPPVQRTVGTWTMPFDDGSRVAAAS